MFVSIFDELRVPESELAIELTSEFEAALRSHAQNFRVVSGDDLKRMAASHDLPEATPSYPPAIKCSARDLGLAVLVEGSITYGPAGAVIEVLAVQPSPRHSILLESELFPISDSLRQLMSKRAPPPPPYATQEKRVWVNPDEPPLRDDEVTKLKTGDGKAMPACVYCPNPGFSDDAVRAKAQGAAVLSVQVSADGYPSKISLVRGLPCGLTDKAFEAVERWRFKPATDRDGTPIAVVVPIEVTFRLY